MNFVDLNRRLDESAESWSRIGDGSGRSPLVPTRRLQRESLVFIRYPVQQAAFPPLSRPVSWAAIDRAAGWLNAFGLNECLDPIDLDDPHLIPPEPPAELMPLQEQFDVMRSIYPRIADAFFTGEDPGSSDRARATAALLESIPAGLQAWILTFCSDFWEWLTAA